MGNAQPAELDIAPGRFRRHRRVWSATALRRAQRANSPLYIISFSGNLTDR